jgi:hypothetical protein|tara:strand:+ start:4974 stop:6104 length:1131 start_codon:yes stop_codon:yes gene_type:complete
MVTKVVVFGLSTEGYNIACKMALNGADVQIIDESTPSAISIKKDIAKTYPTVQAIKDDEPLLSMTPIDVAISKAQFLFFVPILRKTGQDSKIEITSKFKEAVSNLKKGSSLVYCLGTGFGGNSENMSLLEHVTGNKVGKNISYYYYPLSPNNELPDYVGANSIKSDEKLQSLLSNEEKLEFIGIPSSEYFHAINILKQFSVLTSILEICKFAKDKVSKSDLTTNELGEIFLDNMINGLFDLRSLSLSFEGANTLMYIINGSVKGIDSYIKRLIDEIRLVLKKNELKASRTKILLLWTLDQHQMKGDKIEILQTLITKLQDYIGDVESIESPFDFFENEKTTIVVACSKSDYEYVQKNNKDNELIVIKANPLCELSQ